MSDVKNTVTLLCQCIKLSTGLEIEPEYFKIARQNIVSIEAAQCFWSVLNVLSQSAVKNIQPTVEFLHYDIVKSTKLYFGFLQYTGTNFYGISNNGENSRELLLALAWLIAKQNVLETIVRQIVIDSILSGNSKDDDNKIECNQTKNQKEPIDIFSQINEILHKSSMISYNLKELTGLVEDKVREISKIHAASLNCCGLAQLNIPEMMIIKRYVCNDKKYSEIDEKNLNEFNRLGVLLDNYRKFSQKELVFFEWMAKVLEDHKIQYNPVTEETITELSTFICIIRHLTKKKIYSLKNNESNIDEQIKHRQITSKFHRTLDKSSDIETLNKKVTEKLNNEDEMLSVKLDKLTNELTLMLESIPNCLQI